MHACHQRALAGFPAAGPHEAGRDGNAARHVDRQAHGQVGDAAVQHFGRVADLHALALGGLDVDLVVAHAEVGDDADIGHGVQDVGAAGVAHVDRDAFERGAVPGQEGGAIGLLPQRGDVVVARQAGVDGGRDGGDLQDAVLHRESPGSRLSVAVRVPR